MTKIASYTFEEYLQKVRAFHGNTAPGVVLGGIMVDTVRQKLPENILFDAISETDKCLPDAIQILTPCTIGNGWMRIMNSGRFALCLYDKLSGDGFRVYIDTEKIKKFPDINDWFFVLKPKAEQDKGLILAGLEQHGREILSINHVKVNLESLSSKYEGEYAVCRLCKESFPANDLGVCLVCQGKQSYCELKKGT
ncbi:MAG: formylmethanofuran dehydrogenase subunit E family protein [Dehalococcoidales bacterium]|nr:formylmethanofuran dehydrogenase subunit E family protein [Dehalococcoidales bacterium]